MIISKTPLRMSFFGGGTDFPAYFQEHEGAVLSTAIDKYIYINTRFLPPFFKHKSRVVWSHIELVKKIDEIKHPAVRETLKFMKIKQGIEIHNDADLPARTGLGSSSTFTVGLLHSLYALKGEMVSKKQLAKEAIYIEQEMIKEHVGCQDQIIASHGGFNLIKFTKNDDYVITPVVMSNERLNQFSNHLLLVFTGFTRSSSLIAGKLIKKTSKNKEQLSIMHNMVQEGIDILIHEKRSLNDFGKLLNETWKLKRRLTKEVTTPVIDEIYSKAQKSGAIGGKVLGSGGGGFVLLFAPPETHIKIKEKLNKFLFVPFKFDKSGSQIIFYNPDVKQ